MTDINISFYTKFKKVVDSWAWGKITIILGILLSSVSMLWTLSTDTMVAYGDAESHLNIAKRVVSGLTPGFAQLGGVWLPLPHLFAAPFIYFDFLWRTGLAGAFVSGTAYIISGYIIYKLAYLLTKNNFAAIGAFLFFALNPNVLYLQATPMTEMPLIAFFLLSIYFFIKYLKNTNDYISIILAALFTFCATLTRYDGWGLFALETTVFLLQYVFRKASWKKTEARFILFSTLAVFGILLWFLWNGLILHDPLYFTNSSFSAKSQQQQWLTEGELPAYKHLTTAFYYYTMSIIENIGLISFFTSLLGFLVFLAHREDKNRLFYLLIFFAPLLFNVYTLYAGQSVLFLHSFTPTNYEWQLFNARYGTIMVGIMALFTAYLFSRFNVIGRVLILFLLTMQLSLFYMGHLPVVTYQDAILGLSANSKPDSYNWKWIADNYDGGRVLLDDYLRDISIIKSNIPMQNIIYIGSKPYYQESLQNPEKYAKWIIMKPGDDIYNNLYTNPVKRRELNTYYTKAFSTTGLTIYKRNNTLAEIQ